MAKSLLYICQLAHCNINAEAKFNTWLYLVRERDLTPAADEERRSNLKVPGSLCA